jgi:hypothetical protein
MKLFTLVTITALATTAVSSGYGLNHGSLYDMKHSKENSDSPEIPQAQVQPHRDVPPAIIDSRPIIKRDQAPLDQEPLGKRQRRPAMKPADTRSAFIEQLEPVDQRVFRSWKA